MSPRSFSLIALFSLAAPAMAGDRLLVAGSDGSVYRASPDSSPGNFEYFTCACTGPANALAADHVNLYLADEFGSLLVADVRTGVPKSQVWTGMTDITSLAATPSGLFVGTASGVVARVDHQTGETLDQRMAPAGVRALATFGGNLFAAAADSGIYSAPLDGGELTYFSCFCFFDLQELVLDGDELLAADGSGLVVRIDAHTGALITAVWTSPMNAMAVSKGDFLVHGGNGTIARFDGETGDPLFKLASPFDVRAMIVVKDRRVPTLSSKPLRQF